VADHGITDQDRERARKCLECPICRRARSKQRGLIYWFVKVVEGGVCPNCRAYERVYGRKAHEPLPAPDDTASP
jgi:hypothetical protein